MTAPRILWADTETFSPIDLKAHGTARYAEADDFDDCTAGADAEDLV